MAGSQAPANSPSAAACAVFVQDDDIGSGQLFGASGFPADVPLEMTLSGPAGGVTFTEVNFAELRSDARGAFELHLFASRRDIGAAQIEVSGGGCTAKTDFGVSADRFPVAACEAVDDPPPSGGGATDDYVTAVTEDEPLAYYRFEEDGGLEVSDSAGGAPGELIVDVTLGQPGFMDGSRAVLSSGGEDYVAVPAIELDGDFTIEGWIRLCGEDIGNRDALVGQAGDGPDINFSEWRARLWTGEEDVVVASLPVERTGWMHLVITRHSGDLTMYQQGQTVGTGRWNGTFLSSVLGAGAAFERGTLEGWLDEVALYDHALSAERVAAHYSFAP